MRPSIAAMADKVEEGSVCGRPVRVVLGLTLVSCFFAATTGDGTEQDTLECA